MNSLELVHIATKIKRNNIISTLNRHYLLLSLGDMTLTFSDFIIKWLIYRVVCFKDLNFDDDEKLILLVLFL